MRNEIEEGDRLQLDFTKLGKAANCGENLIPAVAQDVATETVLMVGYVNQKALDTAIKERMATFWSTSRNELWIKGKTSGEYLEIEEIRVNCEQNSILYRVRLKGKGACHTKKADQTPRLCCYYRTLGKDGRLRFVEGMQ